MQNKKKDPLFGPAEADTKRWFESNVDETVLQELIAVVWRGPETGAERVWPAPFEVVHNPAGLWPATVLREFLKKFDARM